MALFDIEIEASTGWYGVGTQERETKEETKERKQTN